MNTSLVCEDCGAVYAASRAAVAAIDEGAGAPLSCCDDCGGALLVVPDELDAVATDTARPPALAAVTLLCRDCGDRYDVADEGALAALVCIGTAYGLCDRCGGRLDVVDGQHRIEAARQVAR